MVYTNFHNIKKIEGNLPSPTLIYHKWQGYDRFHEETKNNKKLKAFATDEQKYFLQEIAGYTQQANNRYSSWFEKYLEYLLDLDNNTIFNTFQTGWRLIVGMGTNPTLETGIQLHHLYGFPYIPGSAVKGLLHHVAELELCEDESWKLEKNEELNNPEESAKWQPFLRVLQKAELVRILFGSLFIQKNEYEKELTDGRKKKYSSGLETPLEWLERWEKVLKDLQDQTDIYKRVVRLTTDDHTGAMLTFFDAVPGENAFDNGELLQLDIMNPHYQKYYSDKNDTIQPSDDQDPNPIYFLAVRPGVKFIFPYRIADFPVGEGRDEPEKERVRVLKDFTRNQIVEKVNGWLEKGLREWGVGAKTATGYGYFE